MTRIENTHLDVARELMFHILPENVSMSRIDYLHVLANLRGITMAVNKNLDVEIYYRGRATEYTMNGLNHDDH